MKAFEIHTFRDGQWKVDSVFDDRELAIFEAKKVDQNRRYSSVKVVEENYDEASDKTTIRTVFRGRKGAARSGAPKPAVTTSSRKARRGGAEREHGGKSRARPQKKQPTSVVVPVLILLLLVMTGIAAMLGLQFVRN
ncbi:MAG: hypothetical protein O3C34_18175 [Proteobacteria bacterium]|nr:hypothetical protein [Pseudomonadota bacterium]